MLLTHQVEFSASHTCSSPALDRAANEALYGAEANPQGHGHNFVLEVTLEGEPDPVTGMIVDLKLVKEVLEQEVVEPMDHRHLNREVPPFDRVVPTPDEAATEDQRTGEGRVGGQGSGCAGRG